MTKTVQVAVLALLALNAFLTVGATQTSLDRTGAIAGAMIQGFVAVTRNQIELHSACRGVRA
ncbi:hypothetical protein [Cereibacter azotoformans]|uniref:Uncharacterized protein n=1 Tax=Cereibacter azotoformans TaxID=43057 RepID=A0A2T5JN59_9RHOB|nr:hypothetical protein [Cereibacter azotoformans]MBO4169566.1 hypothetical protein [Cereibacter azotoformans]PTR08724.1 hypothetical protein C8J28_13411 [Cereibacter azotoformans]